MSETEKRACLARLELLKRPVDQLRDFVDNDPRARGSNRDEARARLKAMKDSWRKELTHRAKATLNATEQAYYLPALEEVSANFTVRSNSVPSGSWSHDLYDAAATIEHYAIELRHQITT